MPINRFFYEKGPLKALSQIELEGGEFHHLAHISRTRVGETVELVDGKGCLARATLVECKRHAARLKIDSLQEMPPSPFSLILAQAIPRLNRLETIVEKGTELGMTELWLFFGNRSEPVHFKEAQIERLEKVAVAALKQCGRFYLPKISLVTPIHLWEPLSFPLFFGDLSEERETLLETWNKAPPQEGAILCIGPESGFHQEEVAKLKALGGKGVELHANILRTDTASIAALAIVGQLYSS